MSFGTVQAEKMTTESGYSLGAGNASSFKNRIINGNMTIWQRGASVAASTTAYSADRWNAYISGSGGFTSAQSTDVPAGAGFTYSNLCTVTTAGTPGESGIVQYVEGYNFADANWGTASAESVTVSFWVKSSLTGTFVFVLRSTNGTYSYLAPYTISAANTWEQKTITIPGLTSQVLNFTNGYALIFEFTLGGSGNATSTTNTWLSGNYFNLTGSVNVIGTLGATFSVTGVQLELGTVATSFDFRSIGTELALCQRYFYQWSAANSASAIVGSGQAFNATQGYILLKTAMTMRVPPITFSSAGSFGSVTSGGGGVAVTAISLVTSWTNENMITLQPTASGWASGNAILMNAGADTACRLNFSAEF